jgi:flagellar assembly protein FliH
VAAIRKFTFDNDFDRPAKPVAVPEVVVEAPPPPPPPPTFSEQEMADAVAAARKAALAEGVAKGRAETVADVERKTASALIAIGNNLAAIDKQVRAVATGLSENTVELGVAMTRQLFPELLRRAGAEEIAALFGQCLETLRTEPRFKVRVSAAQAEEIGQKLQAVAAKHGYDGRLDVLGDADLKPGDCKIEWAQGGMVRDRENIWKAIEAAIEQALASPASGEPA